MVPLKLHVNSVFFKYIIIIITFSNCKLFLILMTNQKSIFEKGRDEPLKVILSRERCCQKWTNFIVQIKGDSTFNLFIFQTT